jgi:hypothetical protein
MKCFIDGTAGSRCGREAEAVALKAPGVTQIVNAIAVTH